MALAGVWWVIAALTSVVRLSAASSEPSIGRSSCSAASNFEGSKQGEQTEVAFTSTGNPAKFRFLALPDQPGHGKLTLHLKTCNLNGESLS